MSDGMQQQADMDSDHQEISVAEFFEKNRHLLGFENPQKSIITVTKEAVDNSLDACEEAEILPEIHVLIDEIGEEKCRIEIRDNAIGLAREQIPKVFGKLLYGSKFHKLQQSRGQQGIGISASAMYAQLTTGDPVTVWSKQEGEPCHKFVVRIDTEENEPEIIEDEVVPEDSEDFPGDKDYFFDHGTTIEMNIEAKYTRGHHSVRNYLKHTAIMNPYARVVLREPNGNKIEYPRVSKELPEKPKEIKPHPHGVELGILMRMVENSSARTVSSFLQNEFTRVGRTSADEICEEAGIDSDRRPNTLDKEEIEQLLDAAQEVKLQSPPKDCLSPIGEDLIRKGMQKELNPEMIFANTRKPKVYKGNPFQVECTVGETEITLADGERISIEEYVENDVQKRVLGLKDNGSVGPVEVEAKMRIPRDHDIYRVETESGRSLKVTGNNELPVQENGDIIWKRTDELTQEDCLATPESISTESSEKDPLNLLPEDHTQVIDREIVKELTDRLSSRYGSLKSACDKISVDYERFKAFRRENYTTRPSLKEFKEMLAHCDRSMDDYRDSINRFALVEGDMNNPKRIEVPEMSEDLAYLMGMVESDGCLSQEYIVSFVSREEALLDEFKVKVKNLFSVEVEEKENEIRVNSKAVNRLLTKLEDKILKGSKGIIESWIAGFIEGDGCLSESSDGGFKHLTFCTADKSKAKKVRNALMQLGVQSRITTSGKGDVSELAGREIVTQKQKHDVHIYSLTEARDLLENIELKHPKKEKRRTSLLEQDTEGRSTRKYVVGNKLKELRSKEDLGQKDFGVSSNTVREIEKGRRRAREDTLESILEQSSVSAAEDLEHLVESDVASEEIASIEELDRDDKFVYDLQTASGNFVASNMIMHNCGLAWGGDIDDEGSFDELRFANKVPLLYKKSSCVTTKAIEEVSWNRYNISQAGSRPQGPLYILIHIASVWVPFTSEGKEAVANYEDIRKEMKLALQEVGRKLGKELKRQERRKIQEKKKRQLTSYAQEMGPAIAQLAGEGDSEEIEKQIQNMVEADYNPEQL